MTKRTIMSLSEESLKQADDWAQKLHISRAEFIRRAVTAYAEEMRRKKEEEEILRQRAEAGRETDHLRREFGKVKDPKWDPVRVIREWRDRDLPVHPYGIPEAEPLRIREKGPDQ